MQEIGNLERRDIAVRILSGSASSKYLGAAF